MNEPLSCHACGKPIGVYEPLITLVGECAHETSRAAQLPHGSLGAESYHRECYERRDDAGEDRP